MLEICPLLPVIKCVTVALGTITINFRFTGSLINEVMKYTLGPRGHYNEVVLLMSHEVHLIVVLGTYHTIQIFTLSRSGIWWIIYWRMLVPYWIHLLRIFWWIEDDPPNLPKFSPVKILCLLEGQVRLELLQHKE